jgi:hypothetical protein
MPHQPPFAHDYNLGRLGNAGDEVRLVPDAAQRAAIAGWAGILSLDGFEARVGIRKKGASGFVLDYRLTADVVQACVVTLEPVSAHLDRAFARELLFSAPVHRKGIESAPVMLDASAEEGPEEIESLHYDLAGPALEEFALALDPYPRRPGVAFTPPEEGAEPPQSPFAVLKSLK